MPISREIWKRSGGRQLGELLRASVALRRAHLVRVELSAILGRAIDVGLDERDGEEVVHADSVANARELAPPAVHDDRLSALHRVLRCRLASRAAETCESKVKRGSGERRT